MRWLKCLAATWMLLLLAGCANNGLEKMIPADATGVVCFDVNEILKKAGADIVLSSMQELADRFDEIVRLQQDSTK